MALNENMVDKFRMDMGKKFLMRVVKLRKRVPGKVVDAPSLETFKTGLDGALTA